MPSTTDKTEELRQVAAYAGPVALGSIVSAMLYGAACEPSARVWAVGTPQEFLWNVALALVALLAATRSRALLGRAAMVAMAVAQGALAYGALMPTGFDLPVAGIATLMFAMLLTAEGLIQAEALGTTGARNLRSRILVRVGRATLRCHDQRPYHRADA